MRKRKDGCLEENVGSKRGVRTIFPVQMELDFVKYIKNRAKMCYGMTRSEVQRAAFIMAVKNKLSVPPSWMKAQMAGLEWFMQFRIRHPTLRLRKPEPCSLGRATAFNKTNVNEFYDNLESSIQRYPSIGEAHRIYNLDETKLLIVQTCEKVLAGNETRRLNQATSAERGTLVTGCCIICANGTYLPPALVFPRANIQPYMTKDAPVGTLGIAQPTGWMNEDIFPDVMKHFVKYSHSSKENRSLLVFDNHESHLTPQVLDFASENGVEIVTVPPHCSHRLQPLDVCVYGSLQKVYNRCISQWMLNNPGKTVKISNVAEFFNDAFILSMTPSNILSAFKSTGIYPFNRMLFSEDDFMSSYVTDRPLPSNLSTPANSYVRIPATTCRSPSTSPQNSTTPVTTDPNEKLNVSTYVSPEEAVPYPKASPRKENSRQRRRGKSIIATSTPQKERIRERKNNALMKKKKKDIEPHSDQAKKRRVVRKKIFNEEVGSRPNENANPEIGLVQTEAEGQEKMKKQNRSKSKPKVTNRKKKTRAGAVKRASHCTEDSSSEDEPKALPSSESDVDLETFSDLETEFQPNLNFGKNDFCVVQLPLQEQNGMKHYVGQILEIEGENFKLNFMRKVATGVNVFVFLEKPDVAWISKQQIVTRVKPKPLGTTSRQNRKFSFNINLPEQFPNFY